MPNQKDTITVVVQGVPVEIPVNENAALRALVEKALHNSQNVGQPPENWELKTEAGEVIDQHAKLRDLSLAPNSKLYLSQRAGVGG